MQTRIPKQSKKCPRCTEMLHNGTHKFSDGIEEVIYCKNCGYREEQAL